MLPLPAAVAAAAAAPATLSGRVLCAIIGGMLMALAAGVLHALLRRARPISTATVRAHGEGIGILRQAGSPIFVMAVPARIPGRSPGSGEPVGGSLAEVRNPENLWVGSKRACLLSPAPFQACKISEK